MTHKHAFGYCDRTGFRYPLKDLIPEYVNGGKTGLLIGRDMVDKDHPQWRINEVESNDKQMLDNPRPEQTLAESRALWSWPVVGLTLNALQGQVGTVTVRIG